MLKYSLVPLILLLAGCATSSGVISMGPDTYMVSHEAGSGFSGVTTQKAAAFREAGEFCAKDGRQVKVIDSSESAGFLKFPRADVQFKCLKPDAASTAAK